MPRIRSLKPEALQHRKVGRLSDRAFRLWIALITQADDAGRFIADAEQFRVLAFGYQSVTVKRVQDAIDELHRSGLIRLYRVNGTIYGDFPSWADHQVINRPSPSFLPAYTDESSIHGTFSEHSVGIGSDLIGPDLIGSDHPPLTPPNGTVNIPALAHRDEFERFWDAYPNKKAKGYAHTCFLAALSKAVDLDTILQALEAQKTWPEWTRDGGRYIPHPSTWLNQERWADQPRKARRQHTTDKTAGNIDAIRSFLARSESHGDPRATPVQRTALPVGRSVPAATE